MPAPASTDEFIAVIEKSELLPAKRLDDYVANRFADKAVPTDSVKFAQHLVHDGVLTKYQAEQLLGGRWRNFIIAGKYKLLERLGKGGMALVFLCEHQLMKRLVALKILPTAHADDRELLGRFHREARALSQLRHPNIVGAYDVDQSGKIHFLVMEYIDGGDLDYLVQKNGPMAVERAAHYIRQAAHGLQHAHECGLVHRDIKPGNLLVDRSGTVKLLDLGLARIFHETTDDLTTGRDARTLLGTVDYLAPEQALNSHDVDIRADIYGLGATFYFLLTGKGLFEEGTVAQKLSWHLHRPPMAISEIRSDVPDGLLDVIDKMLAKNPDDRYQTPEEVDEALTPWTQNPIPLPLASELPQLSLAARGSGQPSTFPRNAPASVRTPLPTSGLATSSNPSRTTKIMSSERISTTDRAPSTIRSRVAPASIVESPAVESSASSEVRTSPWYRTIRPFHQLAILAGLIGLVAVCWFYYVIPRTTDGVPISSGVARNLGAKTNSSGPLGSVADSSGLTQSPPANQAADATFVLATSASPSRMFTTLREAVRAAKPGDHIRVGGHLIVEAVEISDVDGAPKDLTIEAEPTSSPIRWRAPRDLSPTRALLDVSGLDGFQLRGFVFDGENRVGELIRLSGRGSGVILGDLQLERAAKAGMVLKRWFGESSRPAILREVRFGTDREIEAAILFDVDKDRPTAGSDFVRIVDCRFVGPFHSALLVGGPVSGLDVEDCRFFKATDGLRYRKDDVRDPIRIRMSNNLFSELQRGVHFETTPPAVSSDLEMVNNVFCNTFRLAALDKISVQPSRVFGRWIWTQEGEGKKTPVMPPGARYFRKVFSVNEVPEKATLDISCDESFVVWLNGTEVGRNPLPHFTQRVFSFEVSGMLRPGKNIIAVQGTNLADRLNAKFGTSAALLAQITTRQGSKEIFLARTDETWKSSAQGTDGWNQLNFDDHAWTAARPWPDSGNGMPWQNVVWDSVILPEFKPPLEKIEIKASGNVRDYKSWESYPILDAERLVIEDETLLKDPGNDATFLRFPKSHPLLHAGPGGSRVGVFQAD